MRPYVFERVQMRIEQSDHGVDMLHVQFVETLGFGQGEIAPIDRVKVGQVVLLCGKEANVEKGLATAWTKARDRVRSRGARIDAEQAGLAASLLQLTFGDRRGCSGRGARFRPLATAAGTSRASDSVGSCGGRRRSLGIRRGDRFGRFGANIAITGRVTGLREQLERVGERWQPKIFRLVRVVRSGCR